MDRNPDALSFLPRSVIRLLAGKGGEFDFSEGSVLFADVAGFTPLTEALLVLGKEGSEELTRILNHHFSSMIGITERYGGDVLRFAGDAITVLFPGDDGREAVSCGLAMLMKMKEYSRVRSRAGEFELAMKIGCARGAVQIGLVGPDGARDYYAFGAPLDLSADAEHHASRGDLVVSEDVAVPPGLERTGLEKGFSLVTGTPPEPSGKAGAHEQFPAPDMTSILPSYIIEQSQPGVMGEHRGTTVLFLSFRLPAGTPEEAHRELTRIYSEMLSVTNKYGGVLNKIDFGDKGAKAVILFGAPLACENKEEMAVRAGMELVRISGMEGVVKMGVTTSHLFSGPLGSPGRREFTVMGDGINLSARLMGYSKPGEIITDENTFVRSSHSIEFRDRGEISVKGKSGLIRIFEPASIREESGGASAKKLYGMGSVQQEIKEWLLSGDRVPLAVLGDIGSGKTAAADWLFREATLREFNVQRVDLQPFSREMFFSLFSRLLKKIFGIKRVEDLPKVVDFIPPVSREFVSLLPPYFGFEETKDRTLDKLGPKDRRDIAYSMLLALFENIEDTVFIVDNLSFADQASLDFLSYALDNSEKKLLDIAAFSRKEVMGYGVFDVFRRVIELPPLEKGHLSELLLEEYRLRSVSDSFLGFLLDKSKGNPRLVNALMASITNEGLVFEKDGACYLDEDRLFKTQFPDSLEAVYLKEFDKLPAREKQLLFEASIFGTNVSMNLLARLSSFSQDEIEAAAKNLEGKGFGRVDNSGKRPYFVFSDTLLYEAVYNLAPFSLKRDFHGEIFKALLEMEGEGKPATFPYLAYHSERAGETDNAIKFHRLAGRYFVERSDNVSALKHLEYVVNKSDKDYEYFDDSFRLLNIFSELGKFTESKSFLSVLDGFKDKMSPEHTSRFLTHESFKNIREKNVALSEKNLCEALKISEDSHCIPEIARSLTNLVGVVYGPSGRFEEGKKALERLLSLPRFEGDAVFRVVALMNLGTIYRRQKVFSDSHNSYAKSLRLAIRNKLIPRQSAILNNLRSLAYDMNRYDTALTYAKKGIELAKALSQRDLYLDISIQYSLSLWSKGETTFSIKTVSDSIEKAKLYNKPYDLANGLLVLGVSQFEELMFFNSLNNIFLSIKEFQNLSCGFETHSAKLELLRTLTFLGDHDKFFSTVLDWGGRDKMLEEARVFSLPQQLLSVLDATSANPSSDPDSAFLYWIIEKSKKELASWHEILADRENTIRHDLRIKWTWAYLSKGLEPPFNPMKLLSRSPGGIFGLRILALLWRQDLENNNIRKARSIRKRLLDKLYFAKVHSDERIWECIIKDKDIAAVILGRL